MGDRKPGGGSRRRWAAAAIVPILVLGVGEPWTPAAAEVVHSSEISDAQAKALGKKLQLLDRLVKSPSLASRLESSGNEVALRSLAEAGQALADARTRFDAGEYAGAEVAINSGLQLVSKASKLGKDPAQRVVAERDRYLELKERVRTFALSLQRVTSDKLSQPAQQRIDHEAVVRDLLEAEKSAEGEDYRAAIDRLQAVADKIELALTHAMHKETVVHALSFESLEEEYAYEVQRNSSFEMLIEVFRRKRASPPAEAKNTDEALAWNIEVRRQAEALMSEGRQREAITRLEEGTDRLARTLRRAGLAF